ncbi:hypothetical protein, partial [Comamonas resistens]|uniref:hypothetical protein n=1 Tax=Comamonas resistens TaxID=3046670 RepID=UPI0039BC5B90
MTPLQSDIQKYAPETAHAKAITKKTQCNFGMPSAPVYLDVQSHSEMVRMKSKATWIFFPRLAH